MKKIVLIATVAVALSGCASTLKVLSKPPTATYDVSQSQAEVAFCLANANNTTPFDRDDGSKVVLIKNGYGAVSLAFTVYSAGEGRSRVEYRRQFGTIGGVWRRCLGLTGQDDNDN